MSSRNVQVLSTADIEAAAAAASQAEVDPEIRGDPRMSLAVEAKLNNPHISLSDALKIGGFEYGPGATASVLDSENVTLGQRKNQLNRRLRRARLDLASNTERGARGQAKTATVSSSTSLTSESEQPMAGRKRPPTTAALHPQNDSQRMRPSSAGPSPDAFPFLSGYTPAPAAFPGNPLRQQQQAPVQGQLGSQMPQRNTPLATSGGSSFQGQMTAMPGLQELTQSLLLQNQVVEQSLISQPQQQDRQQQQLHQEHQQRQQQLLQLHIHQQAQILLQQQQGQQLARQQGQQQQQQQQQQPSFPNLSGDLVPPKIDPGFLSKPFQSHGVFHPQNQNQSDTFSLGSLPSLGVSHQQQQEQQRMSNVALMNNMLNNSTSPPSILGGSISSSLGENNSDEGSGDNKEKITLAVSSPNRLLGNGVLENSGVVSDDTDPRMEAALSLFDQGLSAFYQASMLRAGYTLDQVQETSAEYRRFTYHAWSRECQRLQHAMVQNPSAPEGSLEAPIVRSSATRSNDAAASVAGRAVNASPDSDITQSNTVTCTNSTGGDGSGIYEKNTDARGSGSSSLREGLTGSGNVGPVASNSSKTSSHGAGKLHSRDIAR